MSFFSLGESANQYLIFGAVDIAAGVAIAPHSILGTDINSRLTIASGACLGSGVVIQARWGALVIEAGASIGSGVLIVGHGYIGSGACIGTDSTLINPQVQARSIIAPASLVGNVGRSPGESTSTSQHVTDVSSTVVINSANGKHPGAADDSEHHNHAGSPEENGPPEEHGPSEENLVRVYGQAHVNRLLDSLFPHRRSIDP